MKLGLPLLRVLLGGLFVGHGTQKLFGWFGGHGLEGTGAFFESIGMRPGKRHAAMAGASEAAGGALLALGFLTPLSATLITSVMTQATRSVHADKGPWNSDGGWELPAVVVAALAAVAEAGPGPLSLDRALGAERSGPAWAALAIGAGVAGPFLLVRDEEPAQEQSPAEAMAAPTGGAATPAS